MLRLPKKMSNKAGLSPGTLVHIGEKKADTVRLSLISYDGARLQEKEIGSVDEVPTERDGKTVTWLNVDGLHDIAAIEAVGRCFGLHPLVMEDIVNTGQRPKAEDHDAYLYLVVRMLSYDVEAHRVVSEQLSVVLGNGYILSFQERRGDVFEPVRERIRKGKGALRKSGADYLAYALLDAVVDHYFVILEHLNARVEDLEEELLGDPSPDTLKAIHAIKKEILAFHRQVWPLRDMMVQLKKGEFVHISKATRLFFQDVSDHTVRALETAESLRDSLNSLQDLYLSILSNRMNAVMKVLTIIATLFIPLTFIAGIYGMNFVHMPELSWKWGYPAVWAVMITVAAGLVVYFKKNRWL
jgi:magnesium transporter